MVNPKDFLPPPPWDGPPVPRFLSETMYIQSYPAREYLYHHAYYGALKDIARRWGITASPGKYVISLTTDPGRYLSPMPFIVAVTVDGVVQIPYTEEMKRVTVPCLYHTRSPSLVEKARAKGFKVFREKDLPPEYKYIKHWVTHSDFFIDENEYAVVARELSLPVESIVYVHPRKLKRFMKDLGPYPMKVKSLEELIS